MSIRLSKPFLAVAAAATVASGVGLYAWREEHRQPILEIYVFALKSGRSMLIRTPDDHRILVDGGANSEVVRHITGVLPFYSRRIDSIVLTNTDDKNVSGLIDVLDRYDIGHVYIPAHTLASLGLASSTGKAYGSFMDAVRRRYVEVSELSVGDKFPYARVLFPAPPESFEYSKASAPELLFEVSYGNSRIVFMGDASKKVQKHVALSTTTVNCSGGNCDGNVLIASHSAAPASMAMELIKAIKPKALIYEKTISKSSAAAKSKRIIADPLAGVLAKDRFNLKDIGTVKITSDGTNISIKKAP